MHQYLGSVGFDKGMTRAECRHLFDVLAASDKTRSCSIKTSAGVLTELRTETSPGMGLVQVGEYDDAGHFCREWYYPYAEGKELSTDAPCTVVRQAMRETYAGMMDEPRVGTSLIFFLENPAAFAGKVDDMDPAAEQDGGEIRLCALGAGGKVLLPTVHNPLALLAREIMLSQRAELIKAARDGDMSAMETLTADDVSVSETAYQRMLQEDLYSVVDSSFMPGGLECDQYTLLCDILEVTSVRNAVTGLEVYDMSVRCNSVDMRLCVARSDLLGEPAPGRRFKGRVWLLGTARNDCKNADGRV